MFQLLGVKQKLPRAIKLKYDVANFAVAPKLTAKASEIGKVVKSQIKMTVRIRVTLMMNVSMKAVMKNENNLNEKLIFEITTFLFNFLANLLTKVTSFRMF